MLLLLFSGHKPRVKPGEEPGNLGKLRTKLLRFLRKSHHYVAAEHISSFPQDGESSLQNLLGRGVKCLRGKVDLRGPGALR